MIKAAPWSFAFVCVTVLTICLGGFRWYYGGRLTESESRAQNWKNDADYWKDIATHPSKPVASSPSLVPFPAPELVQKPSKQKRVVSTESPKPSTNPPAPIAPNQTINAQNGIAIGGGTVTNPTVNNYVPPNRHLTGNQVTTLNQLAEKLPEDFSDRSKDRLVIVLVNESEPIKYATEIQQIFEAHGKTRGLARGISWAGTVPEGIQVLIHSTDDVTYPTAQVIVATLNASGIPVSAFAYVDFVKVGQVQIRVGVRPEK